MCMFFAYQCIGARIDPNHRRVRQVTPFTPRTEDAAEAAIGSFPIDEADVISRQDSF